MDSISESTNPLWNATLRTRYGIFLAVADAQGLQWSYRATIANASLLPASREGGLALSLFAQAKAPRGRR